MVTGFKAFHIYNAIKYIHFRNKKFDITLTRKLPKKSVFLKKWNDEMINRRDSMYFLKLQERYKDGQLVRLFSYYCLENPDFYVTDIFEDEFALYTKNEWEVQNIKEVLEKDFLNLYIWSVKWNIPLDRIFRTNKLSLIFKFYDKGQISVHSVLCFNQVFDLIGNVDESLLNIVEAEKFRKYKIITDKYSKIVYNFINFDCKEYLKTLYEGVKNG